MTDLNEEMQQRRALIAIWASAHQEFRDVIPKSQAISLSLD